MASSSAALDTEELPGPSATANARRPGPQARTVFDVNEEVLASGPVELPYLLFYNTISCLLWTFVFYIVVRQRLDKGPNYNTWPDIQLLLKGVQTLAVLEVVHSAVGLVRAPLVTTAVQVGSRLWVVWGIISLVPEAAHGSITILEGHFSLNFLTLMCAWCITEIVRYAYFTVKELDLGGIPYPLTWLRYSTFILLYPLGVASELTMVYHALPAIRATRPWSPSMPNTLNFAFDYYLACLVLLVAYLPGFPQLYGYMLVQRKKVLGKSKTKKD